jgi:hypothetical protein
MLFFAFHFSFIFHFVRRKNPPRHPYLARRVFTVIKSEIQLSDQRLSYFAGNNVRTAV